MSSESPSKLKKNNSKWSSRFVDALAICSGVGIWPRFIEPRLLLTTSLDVYLKANPRLNGIRAVQLSDLHFHGQVAESFLKGIVEGVNQLEPDLLFFTGDFICYANLEKKERLLDFLSALKARLGAWCIFGNHDYSAYVSRDLSGNYDVLPPKNPLRATVTSLKLVFGKSISQCDRQKGTVSAKVLSVSHHTELVELIKKTHFRLLDNETDVLPIGLNIVGLGEYGLGRFCPQIAFKGYQNHLPGIILAHNPDTFPYLLSYPGELILSGHTHGEQIHLPLLRTISKKLARLENCQYTRGKYSERGKILYVTRGLGAHKPFRFCSPPEIVHITFKTL